MKNGGGARVSAGCTVLKHLDRVAALLATFWHHLAAELVIYLSVVFDACLKFEANSGSCSFGSDGFSWQRKLSQTDAKVSQRRLEAAGD